METNIGENDGLLEFHDHILFFNNLSALDFLLLLVFSDEMKARMHLSHHRGGHQNSQGRWTYPHPLNISTDPGNYQLYSQQGSTALATTSTAVCRHHHQRSRGVHKPSSAAAAPHPMTTVPSVGGVAGCTTVKDQNLAELDPIAFTRLLNSKLQRLVDNQMAIERLDKLMTEVRCVFLNCLRSRDARGQLNVCLLRRLIV